MLRASAEKSASFYASFFKQPAACPRASPGAGRPDALVPGADNRVKDKEDAPLRVVVAFDGDKTLLPAEEKRRFEAARKLTGANLPYAVLMYVWSDHVPVDYTP